MQMPKIKGGGSKKNTEITQLLKVKKKIPFLLERGYSFLFLLGTENGSHTGKLHK